MLYTSNDPTINFQFTIKKTKNPKGYKPNSTLKSPNTDDYIIDLINTKLSFPLLHHQNTIKNLPFCQDCGNYLSINSDIFSLKPTNLSYKIEINPLEYIENCKEKSENSNNLKINKNLLENSSIFLRKKIIEKLENCNNKLNYSYTCLYLSIYLMDIITIKNNIINTNKLETISIGCYLLSIKYIESNENFKNIKQFQYNYENGSLYTENQIKRYEIKCLKKLDYELNKNTFFFILDFLLINGVVFNNDLPKNENNFNYDDKLIIKIYNFIHIITFIIIKNDITYIEINQFKLACAIIGFSRNYYKLNIWNDVFIDLYDIKYSDFIDEYNFIVKSFNNFNNVNRNNSLFEDNNSNIEPICDNGNKSKCNSSNYFYYIDINNKLHTTKNNNYYSNYYSNNSNYNYSKNYSSNGIINKFIPKIYKPNSSLTKGNSTLESYLLKVMNDNYNTFNENNTKNTSNINNISNITSKKPTKINNKNISSSNISHINIINGSNSKSKNKNKSLVSIRSSHSKEITRDTSEITQHKNNNNNNNNNSQTKSNNKQINKLLSNIKNINDKYLTNYNNKYKSKINKIKTNRNLLNNYYSNNNKRQSSRNSYLKDKIIDKNLLIKSDRNDRNTSNKNENNKINLKKDNFTFNSVNCSKSSLEKNEKNNKNNNKNLAFQIKKLNKNQIPSNINSIFHQKISSSITMSERNKNKFKNINFIYIKNKQNNNNNKRTNSLKFIYQKNQIININNYNSNNSNNNNTTLNINSPIYIYNKYQYNNKENKKFLSEFIEKKINKKTNLTKNNSKISMTEIDNNFSVRNGAYGNSLSDLNMIHSFNNNNMSYENPSLIVYKK